MLQLEALVESSPFNYLLISNALAYCYVMVTVLSKDLEKTLALCYQIVKELYRISH